MTTETQRVQHTAGPWQMQGDADARELVQNIGAEEWLDDERTRYRPIARVYSGRTDARLITAAPDLLAALERIAWEGAYKPTDEELDGPDSGHFLQILGRWDAGEKARTALRKARGEDA